MKDYAESFYKSKRWQQCRDGYLRSVGGLCEVCMKEGRLSPAVIVHHKIHITPVNISDPNITMDWTNLEAVCRDCHAQLHARKKKRFRVGENGCVIAI